VSPTVATPLMYVVLRCSLIITELTEKDVKTVTITGEKNDPNNVVSYLVEADPSSTRLQR